MKLAITLTACLCVPSLAHAHAGQAPGTGATVSIEAFDAGWRQGTVLAVGPAAQLPMLAGWDCREQPLAAANPKPWVAKVRYHQQNRHLVRVVPVDPAAPPAVNDTVAIAIRDCSQLARR